MFFSGPRPRATRQRLPAASRLRSLAFESLEGRRLLYAVSGSRWYVNDLSASFVPDGTIAGGGALSSLFATLDAVAPTADWQREFARALQTWANVTPLNFHLVSDDGSPWTTEGLVHGDPRFGDIRLLAQPLSPGALATTLYPVGFGPTDGDISLGGGYSYSIGGGNDLYSILLHESGHSLGLAHSFAGTVMYANLTGVYTGLTADDIAGVQSIYGARQPDAFDAAAANDGFATASPLSLAGGTSTSFYADLTSMADVDFYQLTATPGYDTLQVTMDARGKSLLAPKISIYDAAFNLVGQADAGSAYGTLATYTYGGLTAGQTYYLVADGATGDAFGMGAYRLDVNLSPSQIAAPKVQQVFVGSSQWTTEFRGQLTQLGIGNAAGYLLPAGAEQLTDLAWINLDQISIQFSEPVDVQAEDLAISAAGLPPASIAAFQYEPQTLTATWTLAQNLDRGEWTIALDGHSASGVRSTAGVLLDGDWIDQSSQFPSGDGVAGGDFAFGFRVMPGDLNHDQTIDIFDINLASSYWGLANPDGDPNGDGILDIFDINAISSNWSGAPTAPGGGAAAIAETTGASDISVLSPVAGLRSPDGHGDRDALEAGHGLPATSGHPTELAWPKFADGEFAGRSGASRFPRALFAENLRWQRDPPVGGALSIRAVDAVFGEV
jgi:Matrixin